MVLAFTCSRCPIYRAPESSPAIVSAMLVPLLALAMFTQQGVTVCTVQQRPSTYLKRIVSIQAEIVLALPHGAFLRDDNCPSRILPLGFDLPDADESAKDLVSEVFNACSPDPPHKRYGRFVGRVAYSANGLIEFRLQSVSQLDSLPCPPPIVHLPPMTQ